MNDFETDTRGTNDTYSWDKFDVEAYQAQYKTSKVMFEDRSLATMAIGGLLELEVPLGSLSGGIDACNGGVMRGPSLIAPFIHDDGKLIWSDYGKPQVESARQIIKDGRAGNLGAWAVHQTHMGMRHKEWSGAAFRACQLGEAAQQSIFDLPPKAFKIGVSCFGAESLTKDKGQWQQAVTTFLESVAPGGPAVMLYMDHSNGYNSAGEYFPATPIGGEDVLDVASQTLTEIQMFYVAAVSHGVRPENDLSSYRGMGGIVGRRK